MTNGFFLTYNAINRIDSANLFCEGKNDARTYGRRKKGRTNVKKKISLFLTAIMMIAMLLPAFAQAEEIAYADTIRWDAQYDVVVVGFGGAGATSAIAAVEEGANVLLT